jgi:prophage regulatory protein
MKVVPYNQLEDYGIVFSRTHIKRLMDEGKFPRPVQVGERRIAWLESEILAWLEARVAKRDLSAA